MTKEESYDYTHAFISGSRDAVIWGFWHAARAIYQRSQQHEGSHRRSIANFFKSIFSSRDDSSTTDFAVSLWYSPRDHALLLMYKGSKNQLSSEDIRFIVGMDTNKKPFTRCIVAKGKGNIKELVRTLDYGLNMSRQGLYDTNTDISQGSYLLNF